jgi:hypothetical protein
MCPSICYSCKLVLRLDSKPLPWSGVDLRRVYVRDVWCSYAIFTLWEQRVTHTSVNMLPQYSATPNLKGKPKGRLGSTILEPSRDQRAPLPRPHRRCNRFQAIKRDGQAKGGCDRHRQRNAESGRQICAHEAPKPKWQARSGPPAALSFLGAIGRKTPTVLAQRRPRVTDLEQSPASAVHTSPCECRSAPLQSCRPDSRGKKWGLREIPCLKAPLRRLQTGESLPCMSCLSHATDGRKPGPGLLSILDIFRSQAAG